MVSEKDIGASRTRFHRWNPGWTFGRFNYHRMVDQRWRVTRWSLRLGHRLLTWGPSSGR